MGLLNQDQVDSCDPALMFTIPRLAIVAGLLIFPDGPLCLDHGELSDMFRPFRSLLLKIRELLRTLSRNELTALERALCSVDEPSLDSPSEVTTEASTMSPYGKHPQPNQSISSQQQTAQDSSSVNLGGFVSEVPRGNHAIQDYLDQFYKDFPQCKDFISDICCINDSQVGGNCLVGSNNNFEQTSISQYSMNQASSGLLLEGSHPVDFRVITNSNSSYSDSSYSSSFGNMGRHHQSENQVSTGSAAREMTFLSDLDESLTGGEDSGAEDSVTERVDNECIVGDDDTISGDIDNDRHRFSRSNSNNNFGNCDASDLDSALYGDDGSQIGKDRTNDVSELSMSSDRSFTMEEGLPTPIVEVRTGVDVVVESTSTSKLKSSSSSRDSGLSSMADNSLDKSLRTPSNIADLSRSSRVPEDSEQNSSADCSFSSAGIVGVRTVVDSIERNGGVMGINFSHNFLQVPDHGLLADPGRRPRSHHASPQELSACSGSCCNSECSASVG